MSHEFDDLARLRAENARLIALLESYGIDWQHDPAPTAASAPRSPGTSNFSTAEKVALFRRLFRGRTDVHPVRWESTTTRRSGYAPACANDKFAGLQICTAKLPAGRGPGKVRVNGDPAFARSRASSALIAAIVRWYRCRPQSFSATLPARRRSASTLSCQTTPATFSLWTLTKANGAKTPKPLFNPVANWMCPSHWRYHGRAKAHTHGSSSRLLYRRATPDVWERPSSVTPAAVSGNSA